MGHFSSWKPLHGLWKPLHGLHKMQHTSLTVQMAMEGSHA